MRFTIGFGSLSARSLVRSVLAGLTIAGLLGSGIGVLLSDANVVAADDEDAGNAGPSITLSPQSAAAGTKVKLTGTNFPKNLNTEVRFGRSGVAIPIVTDRKGRFNRSIVVPDQAARKYKVRVDAPGGDVVQDFRIIGSKTEKTAPKPTQTATPAPSKTPTTTGTLPTNTPTAVPSPTTQATPIGTTTTPTAVPTATAIPVQPTNTGSPSWQLQKSAGLESGNFSEFSATNVQDGNLSVTSDDPGAPEGKDFAKASINGSGNNAFARAQNSVSWKQGDTFRTEVSVYLPRGFHDDVEGSVQLVGWDTWPVSNNQMRLIIWKNDEKARLFLKTDGKDTTLTNSFSIPEGRWAQIAIEQRISDEDGWSKVYLDGELVAKGSGDTATPHTVTHIRYGLVAIDADAQRRPLTLYFDKVKLSEAR